MESIKHTLTPQAALAESGQNAASTTMTAVRAFNRVWGPKAESFGIGAAADAGFDGGEWSGPANSLMEQDEYEATLQSVATRFGLTSVQLDYALQVADHNNWLRFMNSHNVAVTAHRS